VIAVARRALPARCPPSASNTISGDVLIKEFLSRGSPSRSAWWQLLYTNYSIIRRAHKLLLLLTCTLAMMMMMMMFDSWL